MPAYSDEPALFSTMRTGCILNRTISGTDESSHAACNCCNATFDLGKVRPKPGRGCIVPFYFAIATATYSNAWVTLGRSFSRLWNRTKNPQDRHEKCLMWMVLSHVLPTNLCGEGIGPTQSAGFMSESVSEHRPKKSEVSNNAQSLNDYSKNDISLTHCKYSKNLCLPDAVPSGILY